MFAWNTLTSAWNTLYLHLTLDLALAPPSWTAIDLVETNGASALPLTAASTPSNDNVQSRNKVAGIHTNACITHTHAHTDRRTFTWYTKCICTYVQILVLTHKETWVLCSADSTSISDISYGAQLLIVLNFTCSSASPCASNGCESCWRKYLMMPMLQHSIILQSFKTEVWCGYNWPVEQELSCRARARIRRFSLPSFVSISLVLIWSNIHCLEHVTHPLTANLIDYLESEKLK